MREGGSVYIEYAPAPTTRTVLKITNQMLYPILGSDPSGGSGIIINHVTEPIRVRVAPTKG